MSKPSRRPNREAIKAQRKGAKKTWEVLRERLKAEGLEPHPKPTIPNRTCAFKTVEEEKEARTEAVTDHMKILRAKLPILLRRLVKIPDPRNPKKLKHMLTCLMIYGILTFVLQMASRRETNRELTRPMFKENLWALPSRAGGHTSP